MNSGFFEKYHVKDDGVKGAILVSGPSYDLNTKVTPKGVLGHPGERAYFGSDASKYSSMSAINNIEGRKIPVFIAYAELDMPMIQNQNQGLVKVYAEENGPIVGASVCGPNAGELIHELMYMVGWEALPSEAAEFIHAHPTLSEAIGESLMSLSGKGLH